MSASRCFCIWEWVRMKPVRTVPDPDCQAVHPEVEA